MTKAKAQNQARLDQPQRPHSFAPRFPSAEICSDTPSRTYLPWSNLPNLHPGQPRSDWLTPAKPAYRQKRLVTPSYSCLHNAELRSDYLKLLFGRDLGMPFMFALCEMHSLAFDCVGDDHRRLIGITRRLRAF